MAKSSEKLQKQLLDAFTPEELAGMLCLTYETVGPEGFSAILAKLPTDNRRVLEQILLPTTVPAKTDQVNSLQVNVSVAKQQAQWGIYRKAWNSLLAKAENEHSDYWIQENHWEPPYFDHSSFLDDLGKVLQQMAPLRETAVANDFKALLDFPEALLEIRAAIEAGTSEWDTFEEGLYLDTDFSTEVLAWIWTKACHQQQTPAAFLEQLYRIDQALAQEDIELDTDGFLDLFEELEDDARKAVLACLDAHLIEWADELEDLHSHWHQLYMELLQQQRPEAYLEAQEKLIEQAWFQALPLIRIYISRDQMNKAWDLVQKAIEALTHQKKLKPDWDSETSLLAFAAGLRSTDLDPVRELLLLALELARKLDLNSLIPVLEIQAQALDDAAGWEPMLELFRHRPLSAESRLALFVDWRQLMAEKIFWQADKHGEGWLHWLLDAALEPDNPTLQKQFQVKLCNCLGQELPKAPLEQQPLLLLTFDLLELYTPKKAYPCFLKQVTGMLRFRSSTQHQADRRRYLRQMQVEPFLERALDHWRQRAPLWVPDPARAEGSQYASHAARLKALQELGCPQFADILQQWKSVHHRRKNLWKALAEVGIH